MSYSLNGSCHNQLTGSAMANHPSEYTISAWIKPADTSARSVMLRSDGNPGSSWSHQLRHNTVFQCYAFDGGTPTVTGTTSIVTGTWYHVAATAKNMGQLRLYVNGRSEGTPAGVNFLWGGGNDWWIGASAGFSDLNGELAELCLWYKELTAAEVAQLAVPLRRIPLQIQPSSLLLYMPMDDAPLNASLVGAWRNMGTASPTQSVTGNPVGKADSLAFP